MKENLPKGITAFIKTLTVYFVNQQIHGVIHYSQFLSYPELSLILRKIHEETETLSLMDGTYAVVERWR